MGKPATPGLVVGVVLGRHGFGLFDFRATWDGLLAHLCANLLMLMMRTISHDRLWDMSFALLFFLLVESPSLSNMVEGDDSYALRWDTNPLSVLELEVSSF